MPSESEQPALMGERLLSLLGCPACHGDLLVDAAWLECSGCGRRYPIVDGIPVLIAERAEGKQTMVLNLK